MKQGLACGLLFHVAGTALRMANARKRRLHGLCGTWLAEQRTGRNDRLASFSFLIDMDRGIPQRIWCCFVSVSPFAWPHFFGAKLA
ncbi:hypothetical protein GT94_01980 [Geobacillus stearothermophilus]|nr:hypothetical protein GT94_01980 [Geobacillus stearothermophilus]